jgi:hypothetical protein
MVWYPANWTINFFPYTAAQSWKIYITVTDTVGDKLTADFNLDVDGHPSPQQLAIVLDIYINTQQVNIPLPLSTVDAINASPLWYIAEFIAFNGTADWLHFNDINDTNTGRANFLAPKSITVIMTGYNIWNGTAKTSFHIFLQPTMLLMMLVSVDNSPSRILAIVVPTDIGSLLVTLVLTCVWIIIKRIRRDGRQRFRGESVIPPMSKPIAYNYPLPSSINESVVVDADQREV